MKVLQTFETTIYAIKHMLLIYNILWFTFTLFNTHNNDCLQ